MAGTKLEDLAWSELARLEWKLRDLIVMRSSDDDNNTETMTRIQLTSSPRLHDRFCSEVSTINQGNLEAVELFVCEI